MKQSEKSFQNVSFRLWSSNLSLLGEFELEHRNKELSICLRRIILKQN